MLKVLVVDDNADWRELHKEFLTEAGFSVTTFASLATAKRHAKSFRYFVIDGSIDSPNDGVAQAQELIAQRKKVVVCSGGMVPAGLPKIHKGDYKPEEIVKLLTR